MVLRRPGGELNPGEDEVEGLKRLMTEVAQHKTSGSLSFGYFRFVSTIMKMFLAVRS